MTDLLKLLYSLILPTAAGYMVITSLLEKKGQLDIVQHLCLSFLLGFGMLTIEMLLMGMIGIKLTLVNITVMTVILSLIPAFITFKNGGYLSARIENPFAGINIIDAFLMVMIAVRVFFSFFASLVKPVISVDAFANWSLRAKVFFLEHGLSLSHSKGYFLGGGQIYYPLNIPLFETWIFNCLGYWNDVLVKAIFPLFYLVLLLLIYKSLRKATNGTAALIGTYLVSCLPMLLHHSTIEYADLPLTVYFTASFLLLLDYIDSGESFFLFLAALMSGICMWTKSEGLPLVAVNLVILFGYMLMKKKDAKDMAVDAGKYILIALIFKLPWQVANALYSIPKSIWQKIEYEKAFENLGRVPVIFGAIYQKYLFYGNWNIAWAMFLVLLVLSLTTIYGIRKAFTLAAVALSFGAFVFMYYITPSYAWLLDGTTLNRNTMIMMPLVMYFISLNLYDIIWTQKRDK